MSTQSNTPIAASAGSLALDPVIRAFLDARWRACWSEIRQIAPLMGWQDRLPRKGEGYWG
jgi:hypothetical protein